MTILRSGTKYLAEHFEIHTSITDGELDPIPIFAGSDSMIRIENHSALSPSDFFKLLTEAKILIGFGFPFEGPSPIQALRAGTYFFNPIFNLPAGRPEVKNSPKEEYIRDFFNDKPTFRKLTSQIPYLETLKDNHYIISAPMNQTDELNKIFERIRNQNQFEKQILKIFTPDAMANRIFELLHVNYCYNVPVL